MGQIRNIFCLMIGYWIYKIFFVQMLQNGYCDINLEQPFPEVDKFACILKDEIKTFLKFLVKFICFVNDEFSNASN
jgi:hypothetical protein